MGKFNNVIFDFDSTLTSLEGLDEIARRKGIVSQISEITALGMNGELSFDQSLRLRLKILKPTARDFAWLEKQYEKNLTLGSKKIIKKLIAQQTNVYIVTGGPRPSIENILINFGIPKENIFASCFSFDKIGMSQLDSNCLMTKADGKVEMVKKIAKKGKTAVIGDGMTDLRAAEQADLFIGFGGVVKRDVVKQKSKIYIEQPNLEFLAKYLIQDTIY